MNELTGVQKAREYLRRPPCWGPNEQGDHMVDMTVEAYEADLDLLVNAALSDIARALGGAAWAIESKNVAHYVEPGRCLCEVCTAFRECAGIVRSRVRARDE